MFLGFFFKFRKQFHVSRVVAYRLIEQFEASEFRPDGSHGGLYPVSAEDHILSFLLIFSSFIRLIRPHCSFWHVVFCIT